MILLLFIVFTHALIEEDYRDIFGEDYVTALVLLQNNRDYTDSLSSVYWQDPKITNSIIFPELIRYSLIRDFLEKNTLEIVYVNTGMADFSIGPLQIKPSFAEKIEKYISANKDMREYQPFFQYKHEEAVKRRAERINRLKKIENQLHYVLAFQLIMFREHPYLKTMDTEYRIRFLSTAYNYDFEATRKQIEVYMEKEFFPWGRLNNRKKYNYADISWYYYQHEVI